MPDHKQIPKNPAAPPGADSNVPLTRGAVATDDAPMPAINVPAKKAAKEKEPVSKSPPKPEPVAGQKPEPADNGQSTEEESLEWRRKAQGRRLKALRPDSGDTSAPPSEDYLPAFTARRLPDGAPDFDQPSEALAVTAKPNPWGDRPAWTISLLTAGSALALLLLAWTANLLGNAGEAEAQRKSAGAPAGNQPQAERSGDHRAMADMIPDALVVIRRFFEAKTPEEKAQFVRGGEAMLPAMRAYYALHPDEPGAVDLANRAEFENDGNREFVLLTGSHTATNNVFDTFVERTPLGPRLDWRFLTGSGDMEWERWIKERPARPVTMRVIACLDDYYAGAFSNPKEWVSVKMTDISLHSTVWAYAERVSDTGLNLVQRMAGGLRTIRVQGSFEFPAPIPGAPALETPQVILRSVQPKGWLDRSPDAMGELPAVPPGPGGP